MKPNSRSKGTRYCIVYYVNRHVMRTAMATVRELIDLVFHLLPPQAVPRNTATGPTEAQRLSAARMELTGLGMISGA